MGHDCEGRCQVGSIGVALRPFDRARQIWTATHRLSDSAGELRTQRGSGFAGDELMGVPVPGGRHVLTRFRERCLRVRRLRVPPDRQRPGRNLQARHYEKAGHPAERRLVPPYIGVRWVPRRCRGLRSLLERWRKWPPIVGQRGSHSTVDSPVHQAVEGTGLAS